MVAELYVRQFALCDEFKNALLTSAEIFRSLGAAQQTRVMRWGLIRVHRASLRLVRAESEALLLARLRLHAPVLLSLGVWLLTYCATGRAASLAARHEAL